MRSSAPRAAWLLAFPLAAIVGSPGCCRKPPQEVVDVNLALVRAKDACASAYAAGYLSAVQSRVDGMNALADARKCGKARKVAQPIRPEIAALAERTAAERSRVELDSRSALAAADAAIDFATVAGAQRYAAPDLDAARAKLDDARRMAGDPCALIQAAALAREASATAERARAAAIAEKARLEKERLDREREDRGRGESGESTRREEIRRVGDRRSIVEGPDTAAARDPAFAHTGAEIGAPAGRSPARNRRHPGSEGEAGAAPRHRPLGT